MKLEQLHEQLQGVKKYHNLTWDELKLELKKYGINSIGIGGFGEVFHKTGWDHVVKVFEKDNAYLEYVNFCIQNPNNPHYPKFIKKTMNMHQFHTRMGQSSKMMQIVKIELLQPLLDEWYSDNLQDLYVQYKKQIRQLNDNQMDAQLDKYNKPQLKSLLISIDRIIQHLPKYHLDIWFDNIMQREDGTIVLSDPVNDMQNASRGFLNPNEFGGYDYKDVGQGFESGPKYKNTIKQLVMDFS